MKICYFGTYEQQYPRNSILIQGLRDAGIEVIECHIPLWEKTEHKAKLSFFSKARIFLSLPVIYLALYFRLRKCLKRSKVDCIVIGYIGQFDVFIARLAARKQKIIFNTMISLYDTLVNDRKVVKNYILKRLLYYIDKKSFQLSDVVLWDTEEHASYYKREFCLGNGKVLEVGADKIFRPRKRKADKVLKVLYYGKYTPLHGTRYVIEAAKMLEGYKDVSFEVIGTGQTYEEDMAYVKQLGVKNVQFTDWVSYSKLPEKIAESDICLGGHFGKSGKAIRVVPNKVYQIIAMEKPIVVNNGPAIRNAGFRDGVNCIFSDVGSPKSIAEAIIRLHDDKKLRERIAKNAYTLYQKKFSPEVLTQRLIGIIKEANDAR